MPDVHIARHGDRWAVTLAGDDAPVFESYTREEQRPGGESARPGEELREPQAGL